MFAISSFEKFIMDSSSIEDSRKVNWLLIQSIVKFAIKVSIFLLIFFLLSLATLVLLGIFYAWIYLVIFDVHKTQPLEEMSSVWEPTWWNRSSTGVKYQNNGRPWQSSVLCGIAIAAQLFAQWYPVKQKKSGPSQLCKMCNYFWLKPMQINCISNTKNTLRAP